MTTTGPAAAKAAATIEHHEPVATAFAAASDEMLRFPPAEPGARLCNAPSRVVFRALALLDRAGTTH
jgi:hypothetical protein